jgi:thiamine pyrophosphokinase
MAGHDQTLVVAAGDVDSEALAGLVSATADRGERPFVVAADGGAARCLAAGVAPDLVVGDFDSLPADVRGHLAELGVELQAADPDKDESDMELCLLEARRRAGTPVTVIGALGILRPEHSIANILLLADPRFDGLELAIVGRGSRIWRMGSQAGPGEALVEGRPGDFVSLLPLEARVDGVRTEGLRFPLRDETLWLGPSRGLSNELIGDHGRITTRRGRLLVVHTDGRAEDGLPADGRAEAGLPADAPAAAGLPASQREE